MKIEWKQQHGKMPVKIANEKFMNSFSTYNTHCTPSIHKYEESKKIYIQFYSNTDLNSIRNHLIPLRTQSNEILLRISFVSFYLLIQRYGRTKIQFTFLFDLQGLLLIYAFRSSSFFIVCSCKMEMKAISCSLTSRPIHTATLCVNK